MNLNSFPDYPIIDGFLLDTRVKCNLRFRNVALAQLERLRRAGSYRYRQWMAPRANDATIPADDSFEEEIHVVPGAAIWGFTFILSGNTGPFSFNIRDACTDVWFNSEVVRGDNYSPAYRQQPFPGLLVCGPPGLLAVEICSQQATAATGVQLVLYGGEPVC